jgi:hypothetical protein
MHCSLQGDIGTLHRKRVTVREEECLGVDQVKDRQVEIGGDDRREELSIYYFVRFCLSQFPFADCKPLDHV